MLYPLHLLVGDASTGWRLEVTRVRTWRPTLLVPRQLCLFESLACGELRLFELPGFARLQVRRLSPFARNAASAVRQKGQLLLWIWDVDEVGAALRSAGANPAAWALKAEPTYLNLPSAEGLTDLRCTQGLDRIRVAQSGLMKSELFSPAPLDLSVLRSRPVAHDWLSTRTQATGEPQWQWQRAFNITLVAAAGALLCVDAFQFGAVQAEQRRAQEQVARMDRLAQQRQDERRLAQRTAQDLAWVARYRAASEELDLAGLLEALRSVLESNGVVIREIDASAQVVKLTLATVGGEIRMPDVLAGLSGVDGLGDVQLLNHNELSVVTFSFAPRGFVWRQGPGQQAPSWRAEQRQ